MKNKCQFLDLPFHSRQAASGSRIAAPGHKQNATSGPKHDAHDQKHNTQGQNPDAH